MSHQHSIYKGPQHACGFGLCAFWCPTYDYRANMRNILGYWNYKIAQSLGSHPHFSTINNCSLHNIINIEKQKVAIWINLSRKSDDIAQICAISSYWDYKIAQQNLIIHLKPNISCAISRYWKTKMAAHWEEWIARSVGSTGFCLRTFPPSPFLLLTSPRSGARLRPP